MAAGRLPLLREEDHDEGATQTEQKPLLTSRRPIRNLAHFLLAVFARSLPFLILSNGSFFLSHAAKGRKRGIRAKWRVIPV